MKKTNLSKLCGLYSFTTILLFSGANVAASEPTIKPITPQNITFTNTPSKFEITLGPVYLQPGADNLGWAATTTVLPIPSPNWKIHTIHPTYQPGFILGGRYIFPSVGSDIQISWTHLHTNDTNYVSVDPNSQWVSPFSQTGTPPTGGEITGVASLKKATGKLSFDYDVVNIDAGKFLDLSPYMQLRLFSGLSGLNLREQLTSYFNGLPKVAFTLENTSTYIGLGPRLGIDNIFHIHNGLNIVCQMAGSLLVGNMQPAQYKFTGMGTKLAAVGIATNYEGVNNSSVTQVVPAIDAKLGVNYLFLMQHDSTLTIELGWTGALYINPLSSYETNTNVIALDSGSLSTSSVKHTQSNFSVTGLYLTGSWAF